MRLLTAVLLLFSFNANADTLIFTACGDPVLFVYTDGESSAIIPADRMTDDHAANILDDIHNDKARIVDIDISGSKHLACGVTL